MYVMKIKNPIYGPLVATMLNVLLVYAVYMVCRMAYVWENWSLFADGWEALDKWDLLRGSLRFDTSAIAYTNGLYVLLMLWPGGIALRRWWQRVCKWFFVIVNSLAMSMNLADAVYSQFTGRRTTSTFFREFSNEGNLGTIFFTEVLNHWYLVLLGVALIAAMWLLYTEVEPKMKMEKGKAKLKSEKRLNFHFSIFIFRFSIFILIFPLAAIGMRGGASRAIRPIANSNANQYVNQPSEAAIVLNTPFSMIRTVGKTTFVDPGWYTPDELSSIYLPLHNSGSGCGNDTLTHSKNIVVLIVESFGREYIGFYNHSLDGGAYKGYTPFVDSLLAVSLTWEQTYANGRKSIDAMPSILSSIPMFVEPFFVTNYSLNRVSGLAGELGREGYSSAFFHGAENGSMGFQAFARTTGFQEYYGRTEFDDDSRFDGERDFDGTWAIWDEPFLQFYALKMSEMQEPFVTAVFTASSHHPFAIPEQYRDTFPEEGIVMHKCIRYADHALRRFFETASRQPWYKNTIFVLTSDHTNLSDHAEYKTAIGSFSAPILVFDPSGELPRGVMPGMAQQIDIMPTLLGIVGYRQPYVAFGRDLLAADTVRPWTVNYSGGIYQYLSADTLVQFDGNDVTATYDIAADPLLRHPLPEAPQGHIARLKAIIQQYMQRMINDKLTYREEK